MDLTHAAPAAVALLGLGLGMRHATDADHVIAVSAIVTRERRLGVAARIGLCWGVGHTLTILIVGMLIIVFKVSIPPRIGRAMEFAVAVALILLGIPAVMTLARRALARLFRWESVTAPTIIVHSHPHSHGAAHAHRHPHVHVVGGVEVGARDSALPFSSGDGPKRESPAAGGPHVEHRDHRLPPQAMPALAQAGTRFPQAKAFGVGLVHGLAGSAAIALLVLSAIPNPLWGVLYLVVFGLGTIIGMIIVTTAIGMPLMVAAERAAGLNRALALGSGLLSFGFGAFLAWQIGCG
ncbi:MAG TPA: hypothetical protein VFB33_12980 [Candidatus Binataceae bacterium]|nr:hypothetical protein [Candidatus Binataceae bacterium]